MSTRGQGYYLNFEPGLLQYENFETSSAIGLVTKFYVQPSEAEEINICSDGAGHMTNMSAMPVDSKPIIKRP